MPVHTAIAKRSPVRVTVMQLHFDSPKHLPYPDPDPHATTQTDHYSASPEGAPWASRGIFPIPDCLCMRDSSRLLIAHLFHLSGRGPWPDPARTLTLTRTSKMLSDS